MTLRVGSLCLLVLAVLVALAPRALASATDPDELPLRPNTKEWVEHHSDPYKIYNLADHEVHLGKLQMAKRAMDRLQLPDDLREKAVAAYRKMIAYARGDVDGPGSAERLARGEHWPTKAPEL
jgi:hypothetical protein